MDKNNAAPVMSKQEFSNKVHRVGLIWGAIVPFVFVISPLVVTLAFNLDESAATVINTTLPLAIIFGINGLVDRMAFAPVMGSFAIYLSTTTGNMQNAKLPACMNAVTLIGLDEGSEKANMVSTIAVAVCSLVTTISLIVAMIFLGPLLGPVLSNPILQPGFSNIFVAMLPPMLLPMAMRHPKSLILPLALALILCKVLGIGRFTENQSYMIIVVMVVTVAFNYFNYKRKAYK